MHANHTVDGRNPAPPGMYKHCIQWDKVPINWCRISAINSIKNICKSFRRRPPLRHLLLRILLKGAGSKGVGPKCRSVVEMCNLIKGGDTPGLSIMTQLAGTLQWFKSHQTFVLLIFASTTHRVSMFWTILWTHCFNSGTNVQIFVVKIQGSSFYFLA